MQTFVIAYLDIYINNKKIEFITVIRCVAYSRYKLYIKKTSTTRIKNTKKFTRCLDVTNIACYNEYKDKKDKKIVTRCLNESITI